MPNTVTGVAPAKIFLKRRLEHDWIRSNPICPVRQTIDKPVKSLQDEQRKFRDLSVGDNVVVLNFSQGPKWLSGQVMERTGPLSYKIAVGNKVFRRHIDQTCKVHPQVHISVDSENIDKGSHLQGTCPPTITPPEVRIDLDTEESLVACRPEGSQVAMLNSAPETEEAPKSTTHSTGNTGCIRKARFCSCS